MLNITAIDKKKSKVSLEDGETFALYRGELRRYGIEEGKELNETVVTEIYEEVLKKRARERSFYLLKSSDKTEGQIRTKLKQGYYPDVIIDDVIAFLKSYHYVDDFRYAQNYIYAYQGKKSLKIIRQELFAKGLSKTCVEEMMSELEMSEGKPDETKVIYDLLKKKRYCYGSDWKEQNKMIAFLLRKGFEMEDVLHCLKNPPEEEM